jgi:hypothetical protein
MGITNTNPNLHVLGGDWGKREQCECFKPSKMQAMED